MPGGGRGCQGKPVLNDKKQAAPPWRLAARRRPGPGMRAEGGR
jgi:hypothetical protein